MPHTYLSYLKCISEPQFPQTNFTSNVVYQQIRNRCEDNRLPNPLEAMPLFVPMPEEDICVKVANEMKKEMIKYMFE